MSKLKVIRASAGSGKTFRITADYLRLLFRYPKNYKNILAVTFTNKATEEMKSRIISELQNLSEGKHTPHAALLAREFNISSEKIAEKARAILENILHNYSRFSVNTIDSFFQRIIKSFAREAGLQYNYDVALDTEDILEQAANRMLLKIDEDKQLLHWAIQYAEKRIEDGKSWDFKKDMLQLGKELFNEKFLSFSKNFHDKLADRDGIKEFHGKLSAIKASFESKLGLLAKDGLKLMDSYGLMPCDFKYGERGGIGQYFCVIADGDYKYPSKRIIEASDSIESWLPADKEKAKTIQSIADAGLYTLLTEIVKVFNENYILYKSCNEVLSGFYTLGLMFDLSSEVSNYAAENNMFILAGTAPFLKSIIGENDAPFIYEKTGQFIHYFMIDEFQDTSGIQWHNFKPLIINSLSENNDCMVVGDIKQSIYRWRNSDWKVMASQLETEMDVQLTNLDINWRSKHNIVAFNNTLFSQAASLLQEILNNSLAEKCNSFNDEFLKNIISLAYERNMQKLPSGRKPGEGYVKIEFINNQEKDWKDKVLQNLPGIIENIIKNGYKMKDIAILVRTSSEGAEIADFINSFTNNESSVKIQVLSNESTFLKNSPVIAFLIKVLKTLVYVDDEINMASLVIDYLIFIKPANESSGEIYMPEIFEKNSEGHRLYLDTLPKEFIDNVEVLSHMPLEGLFERLVKIFELNVKPENLPFLQAFHDVIMDFLKLNTSKLPDFLDMWEDKKNSLSVSVSEDQDAVRVMTIHKSKGLEYANIIVPFCNWNIDHSWPNTPIMWCPGTTEPFNSFEFLPVKYSSALADTVFASQYFMEKAQVFVDNLNLLYVAFTRSTDNLFAYAPLPVKQESFSSVGDLLYNWMENSLEMTSDDYPVISVPDSWNPDSKIFELGIFSPSHINEKTGSLDLKLETYQCDLIKQKLRQKYSSRGFWDAEDKHTVTSRSYGNIMHNLFQNIINASDVEKAIDKMIFNGFIKEEERLKIAGEVRQLLVQKPFNSWFSGEWKVMNESAILVPGTHSYRPDRVMIRGKEAIVVDYKFGTVQNLKYNSQVKKYMGFLKEMGYSKVEGFVWYVNLDLLERIN